MGNKILPSGSKQPQSSQASTFYEDIPENHQEHEVIRFIETEHTYWQDILHSLKRTTSDVDIPFIHESLKNTATKILNYLSQVKHKLPEPSTDDDLSSQNQKYLQQRVHKMEQDIRHLESENDELLLRLSKSVGDKLVLDNPNISDLSDKNRPTKLGEIYSELYDNEWMEAMNALTTGGFEDTDAINTLLSTLNISFRFCDTKADQLFKATEKAVKVLFTEQIRDRNKACDTLAIRSKDKRFQDGGQHAVSFETLKLQRKWKPKLPEKANREETEPKKNAELTIKSEYKRLHKQLALAIVPAVQKAFLDIYWDDECIPAMQPYIKKCLFLCWMMVVQGPPMCFDWSTKRGSQFDANLYKQYTASGTVVDYVVWPTMFLHEGGPVIGKGVAQPIQNEPSDNYVAE